MGSLPQSESKDNCIGKDRDRSIGKGSCSTRFFLRKLWQYVIMEIEAIPLRKYHEHPGKY